MALFECYKEVFTCIFLAFTYVGSLYIWTGRQGRDHPSTIKKRCVSALFMNCISALFVVYFMQDKTKDDVTYLQLMGLRLDGIVSSAIFPMILTFLIFLGPITQNHINISLMNSLAVYIDPNYWLNTFQNPIWWRNQIVAPFSEEFTFRACMIPLLTRCVSPTSAIFLAPLFFGIAHLHHASERIKNGLPIVIVLFESFFQFLYTSLFGFYTAFLFIRTGHFLPLFLVHAFCNHMGLPDFRGIMNLRDFEKRKIGVSYLLGLISYYFLLFPLTNPYLYSNTLYSV